MKCMSHCLIKISQNKFDPNILTLMVLEVSSLCIHPSMHCFALLHVKLMKDQNQRNELEGVWFTFCYDTIQKTKDIDFQKSKKSQPQKQLTKRKCSCPNILPYIIYSLSKLAIMVILKYLLYQEIEKLALKQLRFKLFGSKLS